RPSRPNPPLPSSRRSPLGRGGSHFADFPAWHCRISSNKHLSDDATRWRESESCPGNDSVGESGMGTDILDDLLKLPASERADLALALWESLSDSEREAEVVLTSEQRAELDRRLADHEADPDSAIPWEVIERKHRARG